MENNKKSREWKREKEGERERESFARAESCARVLLEAAIPVGSTSHLTAFCLADRLAAYEKGKRKTKEKIKYLRLKGGHSGIRPFCLHQNIFPLAIAYSAGVGRSPSGFSPFSLSLSASNVRFLFLSSLFPFFSSFVSIFNRQISTAHSLHTTGLTTLDTSHRNVYLCLVYFVLSILAVDWAPTARRYRSWRNFSFLLLLLLLSLCVSPNLSSGCLLFCAVKTFFLFLPSFDHKSTTKKMIFEKF